MNIIPKASYTNPSWIAAADDLYQHLQCRTAALIGVPINWIRAEGSGAIQKLVCTRSWSLYHALLNPGSFATNQAVWKLSSHGCTYAKAQGSERRVGDQRMQCTRMRSNVQGLFWPWVQHIWRNVSCFTFIWPDVTGPKFSLILYFTLKIYVQTDRRPADVSKDVWYHSIRQGHQ